MYLYVPQFDTYLENILLIHHCPNYWVSDWEIRQKDLLIKWLLFEKEIIFVLVPHILRMNCTTAEFPTAIAEFLFQLTNIKVQGWYKFNVTLNNILMEAKGVSTTMLRFLYGTI